MKRVASGVYKREQGEYQVESLTRRFDSIIAASATGNAAGVMKLVEGLDGRIDGTVKLTLAWRDEFGTLIDAQER